MKRVKRNFSTQFKNTEKILPSHTQFKCAIKQKHRQPADGVDPPQTHNKHQPPHITSTQPGWSPSAEREQRRCVQWSLTSKVSEACNLDLSDLWCDIHNFYTTIQPIRFMTTQSHKWSMKTSLSMSTGFPAHPTINTFHCVSIKVSPICKASHLMTTAGSAHTVDPLITNQYHLFMRCNITFKLYFTSVLWSLLSLWVCNTMQH